MPQKHKAWLLCGVIVAAFVAASLVYAQNDSMGTAAATPQGGPGVAAPSETRAATATPRIIPPANPKTTTPPAPAPVPAPLPVAVPATPAVQSSGSSGFLAALGAALAALFAGLGIYALQSKKKTDDDKHDGGPRCFDFKKMMQDKLEELTDMRGQLEDMAKEKARGILRESVKGTPAGELLARLEAGEKEYNRLKKLFTTCMIETEQAAVRNNVVLELHVPDFAPVKDFYGKLGFSIAAEDKKGELPGYLVMKRKDAMGETIINFYGDDERVYDQSYFKKFDRKTPRGYAAEITIPVDDSAGLFKSITGKLDQHIVQKLETKKDGKNVWQDFRLADPYGFYLRFTDLMDWGQ